MTIEEFIKKHFDKKCEYTFSQNIKYAECRIICYFNEKQKQYLTLRKFLKEKRKVQCYNRYDSRVSNIKAVRITKEMNEDAEKVMENYLDWKEQKQNIIQPKIDKLNEFSNAGFYFDDNDEYNEYTGSPFVISVEVGDRGLLFDLREHKKVQVVIEEPGDEFGNTYGILGEIDEVIEQLTKIRNTLKEESNDN